MTTVSTAPSPATLNEWDNAHAWHPFTQASERARAPHLQIDRGEGNWLIDLDGNRYLDGTASLWTNVRGHDDPDLSEALRGQLNRLPHSTYLGLAHSPATQLARKLADITPSALEVSFFSDNGSCAVEVALKMSFQFWQMTGRPEKNKIAAMKGAYHGDTLGAMSVGDEGPFSERFRPWCFEVERFVAPKCLERGGTLHEADENKSLADLKDLLDREGSCLAAVVLEPSVQGAAGMKQQPPGFVSKVASLCKAAEVHLILDEVFVGFGRLGTMLVCSEEGVQPDFLCLAKGLTGGYLPLAATMTTKEICSVFEGPHHEHRTLYHGHTFTANPLAAAVALRNVELLEQDIGNGLLSNITDVFGKQVEKFFGQHSCVTQVRQRGLACCLDLCPAGRPNESFPKERRVGLEVCLDARQRGVLLRPLGNSIPLVPPILIQPEEIEILCTALHDALNAILKT